MKKENKLTMEELNAGNKYRDNIINKADGYLCKGKIRNMPFWHGWAILDSFLAGIEYEKKKKTSHLGVVHYS